MMVVHPSMVLLPLRYLSGPSWRWKALFRLILIDPFAAQRNLPTLTLSTRRRGHLEREEEEQSDGETVHEESAKAEGGSINAK